MGVYISNLEIPTSCFDCPVSHPALENLGAAILGCPLIGKTLSAPFCEEKRMDDCPLVPVPPHGDLIDRTKLYEKTAELEAQALHMVEDTMHDEDTTEWRKWSTVLTERSAFKYDVADAPTIIPAKEET